MPTIFQDRCGISLYDAQHSTGAIAPIPPSTIEETLAALLCFQRTCQDFGVHDSNVRVVATEATRTALNRDELLSRIRDRTGWDVQLLAKEEEGRLGAMGIASSVAHLDGLCMDMGGGSVQLTWATKKPDGDINMGPSVSLPYGAAALMSRLSSLTSTEESQYHAEIASKIQTVLENDLQIPMSRWNSAKNGAGITLYLSGGGFRGWGHILMSQESVQPYPIRIVNGYTVLAAHFFSALDLDPAEIAAFRVSSRRASQVPAVQALITAIQRARLPISQVTFVQGGVREGLLYSELPPSIRAQNSLITATSPYAPHSSTLLSRLLQDAVPYPLEPELLEATVNLLYIHSPLPKDVRADAALRCSTTGLLAGALGLTHRDRSLVALILCERWGGDVSAVEAQFLAGLQTLCGTLEWWTRFVGRMAKGVADMFPAGVVRNEQIVKVQTGFPSGQDFSSADRCWVKITAFRSEIAHMVKAWANGLEKLGKKKNWVKGKGGLKVDVTVSIDTSITQVEDNKLSENETGR